MIPGQSSHQAQAIYTPAQRYVQLIEALAKDSIDMHASGRIKKRRSYLFTLAYSLISVAAKTGSLFFA